MSDSQKRILPSTTVSRLEMELARIPERGKICFEGSAEVLFRQRGSRELAMLHAYDGTIFVKRISEIRYIVYPSSIPPDDSPHSFSVIRRKWRLNDGNECNHVYVDVSELGEHHNGLVRLYPTRFE